MDQTHATLARLAGGVLLGFGIALAIFSIWIVERQFAAGGAFQSTAAVLVISCLVISVFCFLGGYRFLLNRPNRYGSLLSPPGWKMLAACFCVLGIGLAVLAITRGDHQLLLAPVGLGILGYGCLLAGRGAAVRRAPSQPISSRVFPPETSLSRMAGFAPDGFRCGIEILNDDRTPMEFVVTVLRNAVGLSEKDAIRTMIEIHTKGGVLLPKASLDESQRIADAVTAEALSSKHPLVCRAVSL